MLWIGLGPSTFRKGMNIHLSGISEVPRSGTVFHFRIVIIMARPWVYAADNDVLG